ncbi:MAG: hypothetical protein P8Z36_12725 [Gemmatimonadota bacterium]
MRTIDQRPTPIRGSWKRLGIGFVVLLGVGLAGGCATGGAYLRPAPTANVAPRGRNVAVGEAAGVRIVANGKAWHGNPINLGSVITPVKVRIYNASAVPVQIRYRDFHLTAGGFASAALPPYRIRTVANAGRRYGLLIPGFAYSHFFIAPYYAPFYRWRFRMWRGPFAWNPGWYAGTYAMWNVAPRLPTADMQAKAIPEGVLEQDGQLSGFVYFRRIRGRNIPVTLSFDVRNARTGAKLGTITIPFVSK